MKKINKVITVMFALMGILLPLILSMNYLSMLGFLILLMIFLIYGAFFLKFGEKHYDIVKNMFPSILLFPKTKSAYVLGLKITLIIALIIFIIMLITT